MKNVQFANTETNVSEMCLGTMMFGDRCDESESQEILDKAIAAGVNFIDTAASYCGGETEEILGRIIKGRRDDLFIATKVTKTTDADWVRASIDESLTRMELDHVDMYMIHWPREQMDPHSMMEALNEIVTAGKARYLGCCNFPAWLLAHCNAIAAENGWAQLVCNQIPYNLIERGVEVEVLPQAAAGKLAVMAYRPLLLGILAGKYSPNGPIPEDSRGSGDKRVPAWIAQFADGLTSFAAFAEARNLHPAQVAVAWLRHSPGVTSPIIGVSSQRQLDASIAAFDFDLSDDEYDEITAMFDTAVKEEAGGNFANLRRMFTIVE